jgi:hypothetical protein
VYPPGNSRQEPSSSWLLWWLIPTWLASFLSFTCQAYSQDSTENDASKIPPSLVLDYLPWPVSCPASQHVPKPWRFWRHDWFPVCGFDSSPWPEAWHHSPRLPMLPAHPALAPLNQEDSPMFYTLGSRESQATGTLTGLALIFYLSLILFPTPHFFQGLPGCRLFKLSCFLPWNHLLDLTAEFNSSCLDSLPISRCTLSFACTFSYLQNLQLNLAPFLGNVLIKVMLTAVTNPTFQWLNTMKVYYSLM